MSKLFHFFVAVYTLCFVICNFSFAAPLLPGVPNDKYYQDGLQWGLAAINARKGWETTTGETSVVIAVINSGIDGNFDDKGGTITHYNFPEGSLKGNPDINPHKVAIGGSWTNTDESWANLWINIKEQPPGSPPATDGSNDHDGNGYSNDVHGANLVQVNSDSFQNKTMYSTDPYDDNYIISSFGMGTRLSGIAGAITNRTGTTEGMAGVAWNCKLMQVRVIDFNGAPAATSFEAGIRYAADNGAKVILLPFKRYNLPRNYIYDYWDAVDWNKINDEIQYAHNTKGCVIIAPIGNSGIATSEAPSKFDNVIGVGSIKKIGNDTYKKSDFSNFNEYVDVVAPGEDIWSTALGGTYESFSDTGAAAAFVAGYAGLLFSAHLGDDKWNNTRVEQQIMETAAPLEDNVVQVSPNLNIPRGSQRNDNYGYGLIDLSSGLDLDSPPTPTIIPTPETPTNLSVLTITGTMSSFPNDTRRILINSSEAGVAYIPAKIWGGTYKLTMGLNTIEVIAQDPARNNSSPATIEVELKELIYYDDIAKKENHILFPIDSTAIIPKATVEAYSGTIEGTTYPIGASKKSDFIKITSNVDPPALKKNVYIRLKITGKTANTFPYYYDANLITWKKDGFALAETQEADSITFLSTRANGIFGVFDDTTPPAAPGVNPIRTPTNLSALKITGTMTDYPIDTKKILINGSEANIKYLSKTEWSGQYTLTKGKNVLTFKAVDPANNESSPVTKEVALQDLQFNDASGKNNIVFSIDSTPDIPDASVEINTKALNPSNPPSVVKIGDIINIKSNVEPLTGKTAIITIRTATGLVNPAPYYFDENSKIWKNDGLKEDKKKRTDTSVTFTSNKANGIFGIYDVTGNLDDILIYPIPYKMGSTDTNGVIFSGLKGDEIIKIYTVSGEFVAASANSYNGEREWVWEVKNSSDYLVAQDVYFFYITNSVGKKRVGKIAVIN